MASDAIQMQFRLNLNTDSTSEKEKPGQDANDPGHTQKIHENGNTNAAFDILNECF